MWISSPPTRSSAPAPVLEGDVIKIRMLKGITGGSVAFDSGTMELDVGV